MMGELTVDDFIRNRYRIVGETVKSEVYFFDALFHASDERLQITQTICVRLTPLYSSKWNSGVIQEPSNMCRFLR